MLEPRELTGSNALLEMGTFLSILLGTLAAGVLVASTADPTLISLVLLGLAVAGFISSMLVPPTGSADPQLRPSWRLLRDTLATLRLARNEGLGVWRSLLGISWFWFFGAVVLTQIPALGKEVFHGDASVVTLLLAVFSVGVALGSLGCERLSAHQVEIGLVPVGSIGRTLAALDLGLTASAVGSAAAPLDWQAFLATPNGLRAVVDIALLGLFGGLFIVPLYAFVQLRTAPQRQSRIISGNRSRAQRCWPPITYPSWTRWCSAPLARAPSGLSWMRRSFAVPWPRGCFARSRPSRSHRPSRIRSCSSRRLPKSMPRCAKASSYASFPKASSHVMGASGRFGQESRAFWQLSRFQSFPWASMACGARSFAGTASRPQASCCTCDPAR